VAEPPNSQTPLKVVFFGTYREEFTRTTNVIEGLRLNGVKVIECHEQLWHSIDDRVQVVRGGWFSLHFVQRLFQAYGRLLRKYRQIGDYDLLIVGYPGQLDVLIGWILTRLRRKPLVWDVLMSVYLLMIERNLGTSNGLTKSLIHVVESIGLRLPELLIVEGDDYANWLSKEYSLNPHKFQKVPLGTNERNFPSLLSTLTPEQPNFHVAYFGSFLRNHGLDQMIKAAELLKNEETIQFEFIGIGPEYKETVSYSKEKELNNVTFSGYLPSEQFFMHIAKTDLCLGSFGQTTHSMITIQNKIYETLIMGKPLLTGESPAILKVFISGTHLITSPRNPQEIAVKIKFLRDNPEILSVIAEQGQDYVMRNFSLQPLGKRFLDSILPLIHSD